MSIEFSPAIIPRGHGDGAIFTRSIDFDTLNQWASPVAGLFHSRMHGRRFAPHPHAGFCAITYVLEDSPGGLRNRDSLGHDFVAGPGEIVWTQAGNGVLHEEIPTEAELHGVQFFVNLSAKNKFAPPQVLRLARGDVPEWRSDAGDRVRVVVGSFEGISSPLVPAEAFDLLDLELRHAIDLPLLRGYNTLVYVLEGQVRVRADGAERSVTAEQALALAGTGRATLEAVQPAHSLIFSGEAIGEPVVFDGHFMMNDQQQVDAAAQRYRDGEMGHLAPAEERGSVGQPSA